jgi:CubicO group peptidase (beta-lactamase class C family)
MELLGQGVDSGRWAAPGAWAPSRRTTDILQIRYAEPLGTMGEAQGIVVPYSRPVSPRSENPVGRTPIHLVVIMLAGCASVAEQRPEHPLGAEIDSLVEFWLSVDPTPGLSVAVLHGQDTVVMKGYGFANLQTGTLVTDASVFHVGSVTKPLVAAAVLRMVEEDRIQLNSTVEAVLPRYSGPGRTATIAQLLNHTSGIPNFTRLDPDLLHSDDLTDVEEILALIARSPPDFEPGAHWRYNNSGYLVLGLILEHLTGAPLWEYVSQTQLHPLGLEQSGECRQSDFLPHLAVGYRTSRGKPAPARPFGRLFATSVAGAAGALCSTPRDLTRWMRSLSDAEILSGPSFELMISPTPVGDIDQKRGVRSGYGYGLQLSELDGRPFFFHGGGFEGFRAVVAHYPADDLTVAITANGPLPVVTLHTEIVRVVLGLGAHRPHREWE